MTETEVNDLFEVEHGDNFTLTPEQTRKLIWQKFARNNALHQLEKLNERESQVQLD